MPMNHEEKFKLERILKNLLGDHAEFLTYEIIDFIDGEILSGYEEKVLTRRCEIELNRLRTTLGEIVNFKDNWVDRNGARPLLSFRIINDFVHEIEEMIKEEISKLEETVDD